MHGKRSARVDVSKPNNASEGSDFPLTQACLNAPRTNNWPSTSLMEGSDTARRSQKIPQLGEVKA